MQVAQRGTSTASITTSGYYTVDRFRTSIGELGTWTQTLENDAPTGSGFAKSLKVLCTTADAAPSGTDQIYISQRIEGQNLQSIRKGTANAQQLTLSFWVKSNVTGTYIVELKDIDNTRTVSAAYSIASSGTWEKKTIVFPADTTGAFDNDNANSLEFRWHLGAGSDRTSGTLQTVWGSEVLANSAVGQTNLAAATNNYWQITGVQLEVGAVATPFEFKPIEQELAECQRYYYRITPQNTLGRLGCGNVSSTTSAEIGFVFPNTMRTSPTALEQSGTAGDYSVRSGSNNTTCSAVPSFSTGEPSQAFVNFTVASGLTAAAAAIFRNVNTNAFLAWSAEL
jgi:hypothetical protein